MEWLEGGTLSQRLAAGALTVVETVAVVRLLAAALGALHRRGIVHRDVKPSNVLLAGGALAGATLIDFGLVRHAAGARAPTRPGAAVGTPEYMAPEQVRLPDEVDARADVFSLGCLLFRCLTRRGAFVGDDDVSVLFKILLEEPPRLRELRGDVPAALDELCARMLSKSREDRPRDGDAVATALDALGTPPPSRRGEAPESGGSPPAPHELTPLERRVTCLVLTVDRVGGGDATLSPDQDEARRRALGAVVERHQGRIELLADRSLLAVHTGTGPASDLAGEAARCALALSALLADVPIAIATGRAVLSGRLPVGDLIDRAAGLLGAARTASPRPSILLDEVTAGLLGARFDIFADGERLVLHGEREALDATRTLLGRETSCVGREREISLLEDAFARCAEDGTASAVLVTAPAGAGKSRLAQELLRRLRARAEPVGIWIGRGDPVSAGSPFNLLGQALRCAAELREGEPIEACRSKLRAHVDRRLGDDRDRVAEFLGELCGVPFADDDRVQLRAARRDPVLMGDQMRRAFEDFVRAECAVYPVVLVLEDLHWGDLPTIRFVDAALRNLGDARLLILALARPEVHDLFPRLWAGRRFSEIRLAPLTRRASEQLAREVLRDAASEETLRSLADHAQGNAFYLEELIRAAAEGRTTLPETVLAMVQARLEALDPEARRVLRAASVFGQRFWRGGVTALLGGAPVEAWLGALAADEVISAVPEARFPGETEYGFRHALVREAAYGMLTEDDRLVGHRLAGEWLERAGERDAVVLAEHFERAGVGARAAVWFGRAAEQAFEGNDLEATVARAARGIACATRAAALGDTWVGGLYLLQAQANSWRGDYVESRSCGLEAMRRLTRRSAPWCTSAGEVAHASGALGDLAQLDESTDALLELGPGEPQEGAASYAISLADAARANYKAGRHERAAALLERSEERAGLLGDDLVVAARVAWARAFRAVMSHDESGFLVLTERARADFERTGDLRRACRQATNEAYGHARLGDFEHAERVLDDASVANERLGHNASRADIEHHRGRVLAYLGRFEEARSAHGQAIASFAAQGDRRMESTARVYLAILCALAGDPSRAREEARRVVDQPSTPPPLCAYALAIMADADLAEGRAAEALAAARRALAMLATIGAIEEGEPLIRLTHAEALDATGDHASARVAIAEAQARLLASADRIKSPALRRSFLDRVPENARTLARARAWLGGTEAP